jgi:hypothetical protein
MYVLSIKTKLRDFAGISGKEPDSTPKGDKTSAGEDNLMKRLRRERDRRGLPFHCRGVQGVAIMKRKAGPTLETEAVEAVT